MFEALALARTALGTILDGPPAVIREDRTPVGDSEEVFILDRISNTGIPHYGKQASSRRVQVGCYGSDLKRVLHLSEQARTVLTGAGFTFIQSRPAPDGLGELADYRYRG